MHVQWKVLISLGLIFWTLMCINEYFFGEIISPGEFREIEMPQEVEEPVTPLFKFSSEFGWWQTAMYIIFSFGSSLTLCFITKFIKLYIKRRKERQYELLQSQSLDDLDQAASSVSIENIKLSRSKSKIPVPVIYDRISTSDLSASSCTGINTILSGGAFTTRANILNAVKEFATGKKTSGVVVDSTYRFERDCAKLKDAMVMLQANSMKEHAALSKKLDVIGREKRDLAKQLAESQKENALAKLQLDEILSDRTLLIKRLDCATREIKLNTTSKQMTLEKLEEAVSNSDEMRTKISLLSKEKGDLEARLKEMEAQYTILSEQKHILSKQSECVKKLWDEHEKNEDQRKAVRVKEEIDITQSERDMEKVQLKLCDLEKSLEKLRVSPRHSQQEKQDNNAAVEEVMNSKFSQEDLENINESLALCNKSSKDSSTTTASGDGAIVDNDDVDDEEETEDEADENSKQVDSIPFEDEPIIKKTAATFVKDKLASCFNILHLLRHQQLQIVVDPITNTSYSSTEEMSGAMDDSDDSVVTMDSDLEYDFNKSRGIVSNSPAFQKFLQKTIGNVDLTAVNGRAICSN